MCLHFTWHECAVFLNYRLFYYQHYGSGERQSPRAHRLARLKDLACVTSSRFSVRYCFKKKKMDSVLETPEADLYILHICAHTCMSSPYEHTQEVCILYLHMHT